MKRCPHCSRVYTDESFDYCLDDGSRLIVGAAENDAPTAMFNDASVLGSGATAVAGAATPENGSQAGSINSIAVLPFVDMSADADNEYFCDGLAEELLNALSKIDALQVAART